MLYALIVHTYKVVNNTKYLQQFNLNRVGTYQMLNRKKLNILFGVLFLSNFRNDMINNCGIWCRWSGLPQ